MQEITRIRLQTKTHSKINGLWIIHSWCSQYKWYTPDLKHTENCKLQQSGLQVIFMALQGLQNFFNPTCILITKFCKNFSPLDGEFGSLFRNSNYAFARLGLTNKKDVYKKASSQN